MSTFVAKIFVLGIAVTYAVLLVALIVWIVKRKGGRGGKGRSLPV